MADKAAVKGKQVTGAARIALSVSLGTKYEKGASILALAEDIGRSYGLVRRLLCEAGVELRPRGGGHGRRASPARRKAATTRTANRPSRKPLTGP
ncbi:hypothetical protein C8D87_114141 [Lentzea atacamensis]|uniref:Helix-turn-helix domain-containing protein n=1 Tax=Lentzea atacamensis TaxID=531938 RepID=A0ABX9DW57_9PSEU|nr:helix-turn-helix domain-containing protein [Lentzea atacamensis]RAS59529.1 hypothetical protein C8D87_114141 [Lentzea atacamensis]